MKKLLPLIALFYLFGCQKEMKVIVVPDNPQIYGLASPIKLDVDITEIHLADYFIDFQKIQKIEIPQGLEIIENKDGIVKLKVTNDTVLPPLSLLKVYIDNYEYSLVLEKSRKIHYIFEFDPKGKQYQSVKLMGEVNAWNPNNNPLRYEKGKWRTKLTIEPGIYQYLLVIDGVQQLDPNNKDKISNNMGGWNSVLKVGKQDLGDAPYIYTKNYEDAMVRIGMFNKVDKIIVLWQNYQLTESYITKSDTLFEIHIPIQAGALDRSYLRVWAYNNAGVSNDLLIPLSNGIVVDNLQKLNRFDYHSAVIYNVFVDRFFDGNETNNRPINKPKLVHPKADYHGGDIKGITKVLQKGYFDQLGVNTLWISPIVKNVEGAYGLWKKPRTKFSAYHGYWPISFTEIDDRFGTPDEFRELVAELHKSDKNLLLDFVAHHVHEKSPFYLQHKDKVTPLYLPDGTLNTERWDDHRLTTWFDVFLPTLDNSNPEVANLISDSALWWLKTYDIDGFRHDAAKHVPLSFWRLLTYKIKREFEIPKNRKTYQIGETYGTPELIGSYLGSGLLDAQFDFNVYDAIATSLAVGASFKRVEQEINKSLNQYGWHHLMGNITGNQDRGRFISYAGGTLRFDENAKQAGWTRKIDVGDSVAYNKSAMLFAFIATVPGIPVVYYGDEIGMPGGNDPDNRRMMRFDSLTDKETTLKNTAAKVLNLRRNNLALIYGDFKFLLVQDSIMAYQRTYFGKSAVVVFNNTNSEKEITVALPHNCSQRNIKSNFGNKFEIDCRKLKIKLQPYSFDILTN